MTDTNTRTAANGRIPPRRPPFARDMGRHAERHNSDRIGWLRAAMLGANDGICRPPARCLGWPQRARSIV